MQEAKTMWASPRKRRSTSTPPTQCRGEPIRLAGSSGSLQLKIWRGRGAKDACSGLARADRFKRFFRSGFETVCERTRRKRTVDRNVQIAIRTDVDHLGFQCERHRVDNSGYGALSGLVFGNEVGAARDARNVQ